MNTFSKKNKRCTSSNQEKQGSKQMGDVFFLMIDMKWTH
jgi:hypothetical protein